MNEDVLSGTLRVAENVAGQIQKQGFETLVIGGVALSVHGYPRATEGLDLAVAMPLANLRGIAESLVSFGYRVELREPDSQDPLGGVLDVEAPGAFLVQVVNFDNAPAGGFPRVVADALETSERLIPESELRVVGIYHLIALKLYAGGASSKLDVVELLERNPSIDRIRLRDLCESYRMRFELDAVLALMERGSKP